MHVPFLNLRGQHDCLRDEIMAGIEAVIDASAFAGGPFVEAFEKDFASFCGTRFAIGVGSGTDALWLALLALGIGAGDEVITVSNTFMATAEAITYCGATPVFVDIDPETYTLDPNQLEGAITPRTKAVLPVHLFGQVADMDPILRIAKRHGLAVIEDACQAHGAEYRQRRAGAIGDLGCFSFYPGKNLGAMGEAGGVVTNNPELAARIRVLRDHGQEKKYHHSMIGWNARMDGIQGVVLRSKLKHLERDNLTRRTHARHYIERLGETATLVLPHEASYGVHVYHVFAVRVRDRDELIRQLSGEGIMCGIHYPIPIHLQAAYRFLGLNSGQFPITEQYAQELLSLPMFPGLEIEQIEKVTEAVKRLLVRPEEEHVVS